MGLLSSVLFAKVYLADAEEYPLIRRPLPQRKDGVETPPSNDLRLPKEGEAMRVAMIGQKGLPATFGGIEKHCEELGPRLVALGCDVTVFCRPYYSSEKIAAEKLEKTGATALSLQRHGAGSHSIHPYKAPRRRLSFASLLTYLDLSRL